MSSKLEETLAIIKKVNRQFKNPVSITSVFFSFLKRERDFANVSDRPISLTVHRS
jgi:hypothetical protein